jgi:hypothetical protein
MATFQQLCESCEALNDAGQNGNPLTWPLTTRLRYAIQAVEKLRRERPDAFFGKLTDDFSTLTLSDQVPVAHEFHIALSDWVTARCLTHNNDIGAEGSSAAAHLQLAASDLK